MATIHSGTGARQGSKGRPVLYVLIAAIALAVAAGGLAMIWQGRESPPPPAMQTSVPGETKPAGSGGAGERPGNPATPSPAQPKAQ